MVVRRLAKVVLDRRKQFSIALQDRPTGQVHRQGWHWMPQAISTVRPQPVAQVAMARFSNSLLQVSRAGLGQRQCSTASAPAPTDRFLSPASAWTLRATSMELLPRAARTDTAQSLS